MKKLHIQTIFYLCVLLGFLLGSMQTGATQSLEKVVAKHIDAIGGAERWRAVTSLKARAVVSGDAIQVPGEADIRSDITILDAVGFRENINIYIKEMNMTAKMSMMISPNTGGWTVTESPGADRAVQAMNEEEYGYMAADIYLQPFLLDYAEKGHTFALKDDIEKVQKKKCYVIEGQLKGGDTVSFYIDTKKYYLHKMVMRSGNEEIFFDDFREVDGYVLPFKETSTQEFEGLTQERIYTYESKTLNVPVDEGVFEPDEE